MSRWVRAAIFAAVCVALSAAGHVVMSGTDVTPWALAAAFLVTGTAAWAAARRERGPVAIVGGLLVVQTALHNLFAWAQRYTAPSDMTGADAQARWIERLVCGAPHGSATGESGASAARLLRDAGMDAAMAGHPAEMMSGHGSAMAHGSAAMHAGHSALGMMAAHALAAVVCGLWLWRGEAAAFRLLRCLAVLAVGALGFLICWFVPVRQAGPEIVSRTEPLVARLRETVLCHVLSRRGPPQGLPAYC
ncbi:hypothetical protein [Streptomyces piniterrae]|nr:hypothetical protein [Streptomyces piniterrae]